PKRDVAEFVGKVLLLAFYSIPALILAALPTIPSSAFDTINTWTFVAAVVVGAYWAAGVKGSNSWVMFFYGFAQPGMWVTFAVLLGSLDAAVLQRLLGELLLLATRVGVCAVLGFSATALIVSLIKPERVEKAFDPAVLGQWLDTAESGMTRSHRVLTTLFSLLTLLSPLLLRLLKVQP
ncbi:MAG TPA: hypothetical protein VJT67_03205, partial [Longimicrobiaceae bacterium]|nr:hypothetical protein [Longimicrobiaceae bacterium]